jgi:hypothetical protein
MPHSHWLVPAVLLTSFFLSPQARALPGAEKDSAASSEWVDAPQPQQQKPEIVAASSSADSSGVQKADSAAVEKDKHDKAEEQLKEEEKQRVVGVVPSFNVLYRHDVVSLSAGQKMRLAFKSATDPVTFIAGFAAAGYREAMHDDVGFPWGIRGYAERGGAAYLDAFNGGIIGNGILPSILHQEPRYLRRGYGSVPRRMGYSVATAFICKHDNSNRWEPNYSNIGGNIIAGAISNYYYPQSSSGVGQAISNGMTVTIEGSVASLFQEFWPDISRRFLHRDPTHGLDAQYRAARESAH